MLTREQAINEFNARLAEFQEVYEWYEPDGLVRSFRLVGELVDLVFDPVTAARSMQALRFVFSRKSSSTIDWTSLAADAPTDWSDTWDDLDAFNDTSWSELMESSHNLNAFAYFSIMPTWALTYADRTTAEFSDVPNYVRNVVGRLTRFVQLLPKGTNMYGLEEIERTCLAASARLKIDMNEPLTVHELAAVTQVTTKRLQNAMYAKSADAPLAGKDGLIPPSSAQRWLEAREYKPSIWREFVAAKGWETLDIEVVSVPDETDEFLFVPEARDGTIFSPVACRRTAGDGTSRYTIGAKGSEVDYSDFEEALAQLTIMKTARWRRPNENGHFGIVTAERWRRVTKRELNSM